MSYKFNVRAATKAEAIAAVALKLDEAAASQVSPAQQQCHATDKGPALAVAEVFIGMLPDNDETDVVVTMSGGFSGKLTPTGEMLVKGVSVTVHASLAERVTDA